MKQKIKFVYFDIGGVILKFRDQFEKLEQKHKIDGKKASKVWLDHLPDLCLGKKNTSQVWSDICEKTDSKHLADIDWQIFRAENLSIYEDTHELITSLVKKRIGVGLLSNAELGMINICISHKLIPEAKYVAVVDSSVLGYKKPDQKIFEYAQSLISYAKNEVLLIDDTERNIAAAKEFGWQVFRFDENNPKKSVSEIRALLQI